MESQPDQKPLTVLLLGDTHGHLDERIAGLARGCDYAVHTGDVCCHAVLQALQPLKRTLVVRGNNDDKRHWPAQDYDVLASLREQEMLALPGGDLAVIHGHQWPAKNRVARMRAKFSNAKAVVFGHSHRLLIDTGARPWVLNPGAAGRTRTYGGPSCLLLTIDTSGQNWSLQAQRFPRD